MIGKFGAKKFSPIIDAIAAAENSTTGEIRVHLSKKWCESNPYGRATRLFQRFNMFRTSHRNAVLIYVNLRKRKFAIIGDAGIHQVVGQKYWENLTNTLQDHLRSTHPEKAIALTVLEIGQALQKYFPLDESSNKRINQIPNIITEDNSSGEPL